MHKVREKAATVILDFHRLDFPLPTLLPLATLPARDRTNL